MFTCVNRSGMKQQQAFSSHIRQQQLIRRMAASVGTVAVLAAALFLAVPSPRPELSPERGRNIRYEAMTPRVAAGSPAASWRQKRAEAQADYHTLVTRKSATPTQREAGRRALAQLEQIEDLAFRLQHSAQASPAQREAWQQSLDQLIAGYQGIQSSTE